MSTTDATQRFSNRVEDYVRYRPSYPGAVLEWLYEHGGLARDAVVADIGSGTGILSSMFTGRGHQVFGVEPNDEMRAAAERHLDDDPLFSSVPGTAENTTISDSSVDLVTAGQAFHWFDPAAAKAEFARILSDGGRVALVWNDRDTGASEFMAGYEQLLETWGTDYRDTTCRFRPVPEVFTAFFAGDFAAVEFPSGQQLDADGLVGRLFSSSYTPTKDDPRYGDAEADARSLFSAHQVDGVVRLAYVTRLFHGAAQ